MFGETPSEYLKKHLEPRRNSDNASVEDEVDSEVEGMSEKYENNGEITSEFGNGRVRVEYRLFNDDIRRKILEDSEQRLEHASDVERKWLQKKIAFYSGPVYELLDFQISGNSEELHIWPLLESMGFEALVLLNPTCREEYTNVREKDGFSIIHVSRDLSETKGIISFFHEIGHLPDDVEWLGLSRYNREKIINKKEAADILRSERDAWAFVIRKLRPFLNNEQRRTVSERIHDVALLSHNKNLRELIAPDWAVASSKLVEQLMAKRDKNK